MCGILGVVVRKNSKQLIRNLYDIFVSQKHRGMMGAGISINGERGLFRFRSISPFRLFNVYNSDIWDRIKDGDRILLHHRYPTSTVNKPCFNHPIANEDKKIHLIHNGVLHNDKELYNRLKSRHEFDTIVDNTDKFTDSEVLLHLFEDYYKGKRKRIQIALKEVYNKASGSFAVALQIKGNKNIYLIKHSNPIIISKDDDGNYYFSSEHEDNLATKKVYEMKEGEIGLLNQKGYTKLSQMKVVDKIYYTDGNNKLNNYWDYSGWSGETNWDSS